MTDVITIGCQTSTGGVVISGSSGLKINNMSVALVGDKATCNCGLPMCKKVGNIVALVPRAADCGGKMLAKAGDIVDTGCMLCILLPSNHQIRVSPLLMNKISFGSGVSMKNGVNLNQSVSLPSLSQAGLASWDNSESSSCSSGQAENDTATSEHVPKNSDEPEKSEIKRKIGATSGARAKTEKFLKNKSKEKNKPKQEEDPKEEQTKEEPLKAASKPSVIIEELDRQDKMFEKISLYVCESARLKPITSPRKEDVRMHRARSSLEDPNLTEIQIQRAKMRLKEGDKDGAPLIQTREIIITRIEEVTNYPLLAEYEAYKNTLDMTGAQRPLKKIRPTTWLFTEGLDETKGEVYLLHGTSDAVIDLIAHGGFRPDLSVNHGTVEHPRFGSLGQGAYFSDSMSKVMSYTADPYYGDYEFESAHEYRVILAKVLLGMPKKKHSFLQLGWDSLRHQSINDIKEDRHSVYSQGLLSGKKHIHQIASGTNEFLIKHAAAAYPQYIIYWQHKNKENEKNAKETYTQRIV